MDFVQTLNYVTVDSYGFKDGLILGAAISEVNQHSVVPVALPETPLGPLEKWRWVDGAWVATVDRRGHSWYDPADTDCVHRATTPDDAPPDGWVYWAPGQNKVVSVNELEAKRWAEVRSTRNQLLSKSDWVVTKSVESGLLPPAEWVEYRQALRSVTDQPDPFNIVWPLAPDSQHQGVFTVGAM